MFKKAKLAMSLLLKNLKAIYHCALIRLENCLLAASGIITDLIH